MGSIFRWVSCHERTKVRRTSSGQSRATKRWKVALMASSVAEWRSTEASSAPRRASSGTVEIAGLMFCRKLLSATVIFPLLGWGDGLGDGPGSGHAGEPAQGARQLGDIGRVEQGQVAAGQPV